MCIKHFKTDATDIPRHSYICKEVIKQHTHRNRQLHDLHHCHRLQNISSPSFPYRDPNIPTRGIPDNTH